MNQDDEGSACFPAASRVITLRGVKKMKQLHIGDVVWTPDGWSEVILFTHRERMSRNSFMRITTKEETLMVSPGHYVYVNDKLVSARMIRSGDIVRALNGTRTVLGVDVVDSVGLYNPQTISGSLVVDGVAVSAYTTAVHPWFADRVLMQIVRWLYVWSEDLTRKLSASLEHGAPRLASILPTGKLIV